MRIRGRTARLVRGDRRKPQLVEFAHHRVHIGLADGDDGEVPDNTFQLDPPWHPLTAQHQADCLVANSVAEVAAFSDPGADHPRAWHAGVAIELMEGMGEVAQRT